MNNNKNELKNLTHPKCTLGTHLDTADKGQCLRFGIFLSFLFFFENVHYGSYVGREERFFCFSSEFRALLTHKYFIQGGKKKTLKTGSHSTIHTFKNYFTTVFSVFIF